MQCKTPCFIIYNGSKEYQLKKFIQGIAKAGCNIRCKSAKGETTIVMDKNRESLILGLQFDELSSFDLSLLNEKKNRVYFGDTEAYIEYKLE